MCAHLPKTIYYISKIEERWTDAAECFYGFEGGFLLFAVSLVPRVSENVPVSIPDPNILLKRFSAERLLTTVEKVKGKMAMSIFFLHI